MNESHASINISKSSFMQLNKCKMGPQLLPEEMADLNYRDLINKISFTFHQHARRRLNLLQKVWISNLFVIVKIIVCGPSARLGQCAVDFDSAVDFDL
jgi:hypothetical protein